MVYIKKKKKIKEKRSHNRILKNLDVQISIPSDIDSEPATQITGSSKDISVSGILFQSKNPIKPGTILSVKLVSEMEDSLEIDGKVIRVELNSEYMIYDVGIQFINLSGEMTLQLDNYLS